MARLLYLAIAFSLVAVMIADVVTPLGVAVWVFYIIPMALAFLAWDPNFPVYVASCATVLMISAFMSDDLGVSRTMAQLNRGFGIFTVWVVALVAFFFIRNKVAIDIERWIQQGQTRLSSAMTGELPLEHLGERVLSFLCEYLDAQSAVAFAKDGNVFRRIATYGVPDGAGTPSEFTLTDGLLGQAAKDRQTFVLTDIPDGYLTIGSAMGKGKPKHLVIAPFVGQEEVRGVVELGRIQPVDQRAKFLLQRISESVAIAIRSAQYRAHLQTLLEETQRQSEELQSQSEELRVANEELAEQGYALKETATRLEQQQAELEQTNAQLEEQAQLLESQRDDLTMNKLSLEQQAKALERASRYKSDFLANMSHELRTPLNSTLILAKLLADNPQKNLNEEQVKYANTILASGKDLLNLISDILDLSKIEAGQMEVRPEEVDLRKTIDELSRGMRPLAEQKKLTLETVIDADCPHTIQTDRLRLEQILRNLLSNAVKFTDAGEVKLTVSPAPGNRLALAVSDTGIGIPKEQQQLVFEAFRQIDSTASRKHGGTGLGLSISRELTRLLGGDLQLASEPDRGSTFTVTIPERFDVLLVQRPSQSTASAPKSVSAAAPLIAEIKRDNPPMPVRAPSMKDDREALTADDRVILIVEDDVTFLRILVDLAHELRFKCLIAETAEDALAVAMQYRPSAVILDIGLPDHSGLSVLDRLKGDARTRHVPVHVISANDYTETAMSLGAVGFMLKPVKREELQHVLEGLEGRFSQRMRRVLVVEDDPVQLDSMRSLLDSHDVETVGASSAAECLDQLKSETFDCMVLDLTLPDASGSALLETLSREEMYSFPPVIVYTGRELSADQEQLLRRYSKSIIIKGAKSPERLLDEVTLFLHQVVSELPPEQQRMIEKARRRDSILEGRRILIVEDDVRNIFALTSVLEPHGAVVQIARNGREAVEAVDRSIRDPAAKIDLVLMDVMMPVMDGITATREIRKRPESKRLSIIMLTAKAMKDDQQTCLAAGANDYLAKPLDVEMLLSLVRVWLPR